jgi:hypothetical protein
MLSTEDMQHGSAFAGARIEKPFRIGWPRRVRHGAGRRIHGTMRASRKRVSRSTNISSLSTTS